MRNESGRRRPMPIRLHAREGRARANTHVDEGIPASMVALVLIVDGTWNGAVVFVTSFHPRNDINLITQSRCFHQEHNADDKATTYHFPH
jgi:hypothetical protein